MTLQGGCVVIRVAVLEDEAEQAQLLSSYLHRYEAENGVEFSVAVFTNGIEFISGYQAIYDIILMDIEMPYMDGLTAAHRLRELDDLAILIFITNLAQGAVRGYEVDAMDYLIKPVPYALFALRIAKALGRISRRPQWQVFPTEDGQARIALTDIYYIESQNHWMVFHTAGGEYRIRGTMNEMEARLRTDGFARVNRSFLLNLLYVDTLRASEVILRGEQFSLGRLYKKQFLNQLTTFLGKGGRHA